MTGIGGAESMLEAELSCPVCLSTYRHPVSLGCGHCFCQPCITEALNCQANQGRPYTCPMCQAQYQDFPTLLRNLQISSIVDNYLSVQKISCDDCLDEPSIAVKTCASCEVSLCHKHVERHMKKGHSLLEPTASVQDRKCPDHDKLLEYYCQNDASLICVTCYIAASHKGHSIMTLKEGREKQLSTLSATTSDLSASSSALSKDIQNLQAGLEKLTKNTERLSKPLEDLRDRIILLVKDRFKELIQEIHSNQAQTASKITAILKQMEDAKETTEKALKELSLISNQPDELLFIKEFSRSQAIRQKISPINSLQVVDVEADKTMIGNVDKETADYIASISHHFKCTHNVLSQQIEQLVWSGGQQKQVLNQKKVLPPKRQKSEKMNLQFVGQNYTHCSYKVTVSGQLKTLSAEKCQGFNRDNLYPYNQHLNLFKHPHRNPNEPYCNCTLPVVIPDCIARDKASSKVHCLVDVQNSNDWCVGLTNTDSGIRRYLKCKGNHLSYESNSSLSLGTAKIIRLKMQLDFDFNLLGFYDAGHKTEIPILICKCDDVLTQTIDVGFHILDGSLSLI